MNLFAIFLTVIFTIPFTAIILFFIVPFAGVFVRYRANSAPKRLHLDEEDIEDARVGPVVNSLWAMWWRVKRIEGWRGYYKGYMPGMIGMVVYFLASNASQAVVLPFPTKSNNFLLMLERFVESAVVSLIFLPLAIITNRAITTPHKLRSWAPIASLRILLTPYEFRRPWVLFFTPGLYAANLLWIFWVTIVGRLVRFLLVPAWELPEPGKENPFSNINTIFLVIFILFGASGTLILCPLEVIATRLTLQRNKGPNSMEPLSGDEELTRQVEDMAAIASQEFAGEGEDVIGLRSEDDPYLGLWDCRKRIIEEEGNWVLYRAWWLTVFAAIVVPFGM